MASFMPVCIDVEHRRVLVVGGGTVALRRTRQLLEYGAAVTVIAPEFLAGFYGSGAALRKRVYRADDMTGYFIAYACTDDPAAQKAVRGDASRLGVLLNVADNPAACGFVSPALYRRDEMSVAVSSNGSNVRKSVAWRDRIREFFENDPV